MNSTQNAKPKYTKIMIIALICFAVGLSFVVTSFATANFNIPQLFRMKGETSMTYNCTTDLNTVKIDDVDVRIRVHRTNNEYAYVEYTENERDKYEITESGGELVFRKKRGNWLDHIFNFNFWETRTINVYIPEAFIGYLNLRTSNADIEARDINHISKIDAVTSNAQIVLDTIIAIEDCSAVTSNAKVSVSNLNFGSGFVIKSSNGNIGIDNINVDKTLSVKTSNSSIAIDRSTAQNINMTTSNGKINANSVEAKTEITASTSNANIGVTLLKSDKIRLTTSNGNIRGSVYGSMSDYSIESDTSNGSNNLPKHSSGGAKSLTARSSNGNIDIDFMQ